MAPRARISTSRHLPLSRRKALYAFQDLLYCRRLGEFGKADEYMSETKRSNIAEIRVPFRDIDMNGHMFLCSYISHAESVLASFWSTRPELEEEPVYSPSKVSCSLFRPLRYNERVSFVATVDKIGVRSIGFLVAVEAGNQRAAEVEITWQARDKDDESLISLPEETRDWLYRFLD
jgi:acyl-CoA thioester hydrolase